MLPPLDSTMQYTGQVMPDEFPLPVGWSNQTQYQNTPLDYVKSSGGFPLPSGWSNAEQYRVPDKQFYEPLQTTQQQYQQPAQYQQPVQPQQQPAQTQQPIQSQQSVVGISPTYTPSSMSITQGATTSNIDPTIQPYLSYGLGEAQRLYQSGGPQYYGGPTFVSPSSATQTGLQALEARASLGNPLLQSAQNQLQSTVSGNFLGGNPFFQGAFQPAAKAAESQFKQTIGDISSKASMAGRYGSGAMGSLQDRATGAFGQQLANTAGQLAYQNYEAERQRQQAATMAAPQMASADYQDIQNLLQAGQVREGYTGQQQQADIAKFNFLQNQPQQNLQNYLQSIYGNPAAKFQQQQQQDTSPSTLQNLLGTAAALGGIEKNTGWLSSGWNKLFGTAP